MSVIPTSHAARIQPYLWALEKTGLNVERRLARGRLPSRILYEPDITVSSRSVCNFITRNARKEGIEDIALMGADRDGIQNLEPWVMGYMMGATTLNQLLGRYCQLTRRYISYRRYSIEQEARVVRVCSTAAVDVEKEGWLRLSDWSHILLILSILRHVLGQDFKPDAITLQTKGPLTPATRERLRGIRIYQGWSTTSVVFPKELLATPLPTAVRGGPDIGGSGGSPDGTDFPTQMRELLKPCLTEDWLDVHAASELAGCSTRSLQRRLSGAGLTFSGLLDQTRMDVAKTLLEDSRIRVIDIGIEVGFEDASYFTRAFRRVNGVTPTQYRKATLAV